ncbi:uncharacterized protein LOC105662151 isoform X6 [Megachile rotundata]|uniref:uncharacterized protein LOC105662151 isoform X6 n=1 Tax=Megachile rotundata TaxID=143995 RepID=UPI003FD3DCA1
MKPSKYLTSIYLNFKLPKVLSWLIFEHRSDRLTKKMSRKQKEHRLLLVEVPFLRKQEYLNDRNKGEESRGALQRTLTVDPMMYTN